jgi:hypothetical protein
MTLYFHHSIVTGNLLRRLSFFSLLLLPVLLLSRIQREKMAKS